MDTDSLRLFVLAAEKLNISAAGRALGLAPAVASARLAKLEQGLKAELLHRSTRKVSLSTEGAEFLPYAKEILAQENGAREALGLGKASVTGTLRFAASSTFAQLYVIPLLPEFMAMHPNLRLDLRLSDSQFDLIEGSFDLALRNSSLADSSLTARKLADDTRVLCASPDYLKKHGTPQSPDELSDHRFIAFREPSLRTLVGPNGAAIQFRPSAERCQLVLDDGLSMKLASIHGAGISINSLWSIHNELTNRSLIRVLPEYSIEDNSALWLVYPKSNVLTAKVRLFIDFLIAKIGKRPVWT